MDALSTPRNDTIANSTFTSHANVAKTMQVLA